MKNKFYITTSICYTSSKPHIGNTYEVILTDAIARYKKQMGFDVYFLTGTDEHGQKIEDVAKKNNITPKQQVDNVSTLLRGIWDLMDTSYDYFIRTTDTSHITAVQNIFKKLYDNGDIYKGEYSGLYCVACESFYTQTQLVNDKCPDCGKIVTETKEEAYFLSLSKYQEKLEKHFEENPDFIVPQSRKNEMMNNFIKPGVQDLCVSRTSFKWGVPVSFDENHVVYVWIDALSNYITALGYDTANKSEQFDKFWPADLHVIGKDILRFHSIYWPVILMGLGLPLPKQILAHPWILFSGEKMSKSTGNVIYPDDLAELFSVDAIRYFVLSQIPFAQDGNMTYDSIIKIFNTDLANTIGNLVNRSIAMVNKYFNGTISNTKANEDIDIDLKNCCFDTIKNVITEMDRYHTTDALESILTLARRSNRYIDEVAPWVLVKDAKKSDRLETALFNLIESIRYIGILLHPFMPSTSKNILEQINVLDNSFDSLKDFRETVITVNTGVPLFNRIDETKKLEEIKIFIENKYSKVEPKKEKKKENATTEGIITIDDFSKVSLKVATIIACEKIEKSDKLYKIMVDVGTDVRQVVSGIAKFYTPEELIGKKIILVANLTPCKLRSIDSNGMLLAADCSDNDVKVIFVDDSIPNGAKIR